MKRILSLILAATLVLSLASAMVSCSNNAGDQQFSAYFVGNLYDFDPAANINNDDAVKVMNLIYEPLFTYDKNGKIIGGLVEKYSYNKETRQLSMTLRNTCWSDNTAIDGYDVVYAWERILACDFSTPAATLLYDIENAYECKESMLVNGKPVGPNDIGVEVDVHDSRKVVVTLREGADIDTFLRNLTSVAVTALDEDCVKSAPEYWSKRTATIKTSGPFAIKTLDYNVGYFTIGRNNYYRVPAEAKKIDLTKYVLSETISTDWVTATDSVGSASLRVNQTDKLDVAYESFMNGLTKAYSDTIFYLGEMTLEQRAAIKNNPNLKVADMLSTYSYVFNLKNPASPLVKDARVRIGISKMIDRAAVVEAVTFGKAATGLVSPGVYNDNSAKAGFRATADATATLLSSDTAFTEARSMITAAISELDAAGTEYPKNRAGKATLTLLCRDSEEDAAIAEIVRDALSGTIELNIVYLSYTYFNDQLKDVVGTDPKNTTMMDDALSLAYTDQDGAMYYYSYDDSERKNPKQYDMIAMDYQMMSTDAFTALAGFSTQYCGNGIDTALVTTTDGKTVISYEFKTSSCGFKNAAYDAKIDAAFKATDAATRATLLHEAEAILLSQNVEDDAMPIIPIMFNQNFACINPAVTGITVSPNGCFNLNRAAIKNYKNLANQGDDKK